MTNTTRRSIIAASVLGFGLLATPIQAATRFHLALIKSSPAKGATVASATSVQLWFTEKPVLKTSKISLTGPAGAAVVLGKVTLDTAAKAPLVAKITGKLADGDYKVKWSTASDDGHAVSDSFNFKVKAKVP